MKKTIHEIKQKILKGEATVVTAAELKKMISEGDVPSVEEVDVVTTATCGVMSGTAAAMHIRISEPGSFRKAGSIHLNGVPAYPGPCPNENLGLVDLFVYGTGQSIENKDYGGGFLFRDMLLGREIDVTVESTDGKKIEATINLDDIETAVLIGTRMAFKNYTALVNPSEKPVKSIFNAVEMEGPFRGLSFSGCGDINPLENDPEMRAIQPGTRILLNGAEGLVIGHGTRSSPEKPNLMLSADMHDMSPAYMGGFRTAAGPEIFNTVAIPIPVTDEKVLENLFVMNSDIELPVVDIRDRSNILHKITYADVWVGDERPVYQNQKCAECPTCTVKERCPTYAINHGIDTEKCFGCGMCSTSCPYGAYEMETGEVIINEKHVPVVCRQSDRVRARKLSFKLKNLIEAGEFLIDGGRG